MFTSVSEARIGGCTFSILQLASNNFFNSEIELNSDDTIIMFLN
jgi:hypothetical protein